MFRYYFFFFFEFIADCENGLICESEVIDFEKACLLVSKNS